VPPAPRHAMSWRWKTRQRKRTRGDNQKWLRLSIREDKMVGLEASNLSSCFLYDYYPQLNWSIMHKVACRLWKYDMCAKLPE
jgi:hypothetical protein